MPSTLIKAEVLQGTIDLIGALVDEAKIKISDKGLSIAAVDQANVAMVHLELETRAFDTFNLAKTTIAVDVNKFKETLGSATPGTDVELELEGSKKLIVRHGCYTYRLSLLDVKSARKEPKEPNISLPNTIVLSGAALKSLVKESEKMTDAIVFSTKGKSLVVEATGDLDSFSAEIPESMLTTLNTEGDMRSMFTLSYIKDVVTALAKSDRVTINLGIDYPIKFSSAFAGGNGNVSFHVAPRIEGE